MLDNATVPWNKVDGGILVSALQKVLTRLEGGGGRVLHRILGKDSPLSEDIAAYALARESALHACESDHFETENQKQARKLMGEDFLGKPEAVKFGHIDPFTASGKSWLQMADRQDINLELLNEPSLRNYILVCVPPLSIQEMFEQHQDGLLSYNGPRIGILQFASRPASNSGWWLVNKFDLPHSNNKTWEKQVELLPPKGDGNMGPWASVLLYTAICYYKARGATLLTNSMIRCRDADPLGQAVIGPFNSTGLKIDVSDSSTCRGDMFTRHIRRPW